MKPPSPSLARLVGATAYAPDAATLTELLPFAVCNEVTPMEEPTGL